MAQEGSSSLEPIASEYMNPELVVNNIPVSELENTAIAAAMLAGDILIDGYYSNPEIRVKTQKHDIVTPFDIKAETAIIQRILQDFPHHSFYGEEQGQRGELMNEIVWVIDPIDGTLNFARQIPAFATSIACTFKGITYVAVCYDPLAKELFVAKKGQGAEMNGKTIQISSISSLDHSGISIGITVGLDNIEKIGFIRRTGSSVLDLCYVAKGAIEGYIEFSLNLWDYAAAALIVEEAGGKVTTRFGAPIVSQFGHSSSIVASNQHVHEALLQWISTVKK